MSTSTLRVVLLALGLMLGTHATAATRYVTLGGTDSGSCMPSSSACATIAYAKSQSFAGDTILIGKSGFDVAVFTQSAVLDFPLTIEGRSIDVLTGSWMPCVDDSCPTITPPSGSSALRISPATSERVTVRSLNFVGADDASALVVESGIADIDACNFEDNESATGAASVEQGAVASFASSSFVRNRSTSEGGAILSLGTLTIAGSDFHLNSGARGGAVYSESSSLTVSNTVFSQNASTGSGGAIEVIFSSLSISGSEFLSNSSAEFGGAIRLDLVSDATIDDSIFQGNSVESDDLEAYGGAIDVFGGGVAFNSITVQDNQAFSTGAQEYGGGISIRGGSTILVQASTISANRTVNAAFTGDGISVEGSGLTIRDSTLSQHEGDALDIRDQSSDVTVYGSTFDNNSLGIVLSGNLTLVNSTIRTVEDDSGVGINSSFQSDVDIRFSTIVSSEGAALIIFSTPFTGQFNIENSIISGECVSGSMMNWDSASIHDSDSCVGDASQVADVGLTVLADFGGPTQTLHPLDDSPALDRASLVDCLSAEVGGVDQRGVSRPVGDGCDVGAVEFRETPVVDVIFASGFD